MKMNKTQGGALSFQEDVGYEIKHKNYAALSNDDEFSGKLKGPSGKSILNFYIWSLHFAIYTSQEALKRAPKIAKYQLEFAVLQSRIFLKLFALSDMILIHHNQLICSHFSHFSASPLHPNFQKVSSRDFQFHSLFSAEKCENLKKNFQIHHDNEIMEFQVKKLHIFPAGKVHIVLLVKWNFSSHSFQALLPSLCTSCSGYSCNIS